MLLFLQQLEIDHNDGIRFDGFAVEEERLIFPLGDSFRRRLDEEWMPFLDLNFLYGAVPPDDTSQSNPAGDVRLLGQRGIGWLDHLDWVRMKDWASDSGSRVLFLLS
ncbi:MAG: hypothetical protein WAN12_07725 [Candidatus Acidiferrum sp.]